MNYYKVTYNPIGVKKYTTVEKTVAAESKWHAIEQVYAMHAWEYPDRVLYKAKMLK